MMVSRRITKIFTAAKENEFICSLSAEVLCHRFGKGQKKVNMSKMHAGNDLTETVEEEQIGRTGV